MKIIKSLHSGIFTRIFEFKSQPIFCASTMWAFRLDTGTPVMEQEMWATITGRLPSGTVFDSAMPKYQGEFLAAGSYFAPPKKQVKGGIASITLGDIHKEVAVFGDRYWNKAGGVAMSISDPVPFSEMAVSYENAFGDTSDPFNPLGKGRSASADSSQHLLPNIEYPAHLIGSPSDSPPPASFGPLGIDWQPRIKKSGTYGDNYIKTRMPGLPDDINWSFFNDSPEDQQLQNKFFSGDESFTISGMHSEMREISGHLPGVTGRCFINQKTGNEEIFKEIPLRLDTVWLFPSDNMGILIHRGTTHVSDDEAMDILQIIFSHEHLSSTPRPLSHYQDELEKRADPVDGFKYLMFTAPLLPENTTCGFEELKKEGMPLEHIRQKNSAVFAENQKQKFSEIADNEKEKTIKTMSNQGMGDDEIQRTKEIIMPPDGLCEEEVKINELLENIAPGIVNNPDNIDLTRLNLKAIDDLSDYTKKLVEEKKTEAINKTAEILGNIDMSSKPHETVQAITDAAESLKNPDKAIPLPRFDVENQIENITKQIDEARARQLFMVQSFGLSPDDMSEDLNDEARINEILNQLRAAMEKSQQTYRDMAHEIPDSTSPHPGEEAQITEALIAAYQNNKILSGGDYAFCNLSGLDLSGADLSNSFFEYADLTNTNLSRANLKNAVIVHAKIDNTNFSGANLSGANLGGSVITNADFSHTNLKNAGFGKSRIVKTAFNGSIISKRQTMFLGAFFEAVDFSNTNITDILFMDTDLSHCIFSGTIFDNCQFLNPVLEHTDFSGATLSGINFVNAKADNARFSSAQMNNTRFLGGCSLSHSDFSASTLVQSNLRDCILNSAIFTGAEISKSDFGNADLSNAMLNNTVAIRTQLSKADLTDANADNIHLFEGSLRKSDLTSASFYNANLYGVDFYKCTIGDTDFSKANLTKTVLQKWRPGS